jgi:hypothetical protein
VTFHPTTHHHVQVRSALSFCKRLAPDIFHRLPEVFKAWCIPLYLPFNRAPLIQYFAGHFTYQCKSTTAPYVSRPSRTKQLENPSLISKLRAEGKPSVEVPEEFKSKCVVSRCAFASPLNPPQERRC